MNKKILTFSCCLLGLGASTLFAQQGSVASGGNASGAGGTVSYSIGQVFYTCPTGTTHNLIQGLQVPYEVFVINQTTEEAENIGLTFSVYPNPVAEHFTLKVENSQEKAYTYQFYNAQGQLISSGKIDTDETQIQTSQLTTAYYILKVYEKNQTVKTFKIIKYL
ncbi:MAG: T9SS type A sorting domain-containing protein [Bacteroidia bacterium]|jgi:hypothetical protein